MFPSGDYPRQYFPPQYTWSAQQYADMLALAMTQGRHHFTFGAYLLVIPPTLVEVLTKEGWSKADLRRYIMENSHTTVAHLKRMGHWQRFGTPDETPPETKSGDEKRLVHLFKRESWYENEVWQDQERDRDPDILIVVVGGDSNCNTAIVEPYCVATGPVSLEVRSNCTPRGWDR